MGVESFRPEVREALREALSRALVDFAADQGAAATDKELVAQLLRSAAATERKMPDRERAWLYSHRSVWPSGMIDRQGEMDHYQETLASIAAGLVSSEVLAPRVRLTPTEVRLYETVTEFIPKLLAGRQRRQDWSALWLTAGGMETRHIAKTLGLHPGTLDNRRRMQMDALAAALRPVLPSAKERECVATELCMHVRNNRNATGTG